VTSKTSSVNQPAHQRTKKVEITLPITLKDLSKLTGIKSSEIIKVLMNNGIMASINNVLDRDQVEMLGLELNWQFELKQEKDVEELVKDLYHPQAKDPSKLLERAPVVTMMGHVDHGKTTLLDKIRDTNVAGSESGGITQHIKAYKIYHEQKPIVFLDTPGHEAFTKMRARGANVTDIVVLVVAANDGVMPTTEEAIAHTKAANVKIIVAINKVDLPEANVLKTKQQLADKGILPEDWSGDVGFIEVSAKTGQGINKLLERILLEAEVMELKADPNREAYGHVLEAKKDADKGIMVDILVQEGTLKRGDLVLVGNTYGKIKSMTDHLGKNVNHAKPSTPVQIAGINEVPRAGDRFISMSSLEDMKKIIDELQRRAQEHKWDTKKISHVSFADFLTNAQKNKVKVLKIILKGDTQGSLEVLSKSFLDLGSEEVKVEILHQAVGGIIESDVDLADASDAVIIGFRVICDDTAYQIARHRKIDIHIYQVIYKAIDELKNILIGMYDPEEREEMTAELEVLKLFKISRFGIIAGCKVKKGTIERKNRIRLARNNIIIYDGKLNSLRHFKEDVPLVKSGFECGVKLENFEDIKSGDRIFAYKIEKHQRTINL
jgi:translation initiation factor IF-2